MSFVLLVNASWRIGPRGGEETCRCKVLRVTQCFGAAWRYVVLFFTAAIARLKLGWLMPHWGSLDFIISQYFGLRWEGGFDEKRKEDMEAMSLSFLVIRFTPYELAKK